LPALSLCFNSLLSHIRVSFVMNGGCRSYRWASPSRCP
jgi:hypothetical protein